MTKSKVRIEKNDRTKIILIGDAGSGKISLRRKFKGIELDKQFYDEIGYIGIWYDILKHPYNSKTYTFEIWNFILDFKKPALMKSMINRFFANKCDLILGLIDLQKLTPEIFKELTSVIKLCWNRAHYKIPLIFIGTKCDLLIKEHIKEVSSIFRTLIEEFNSHENITTSYILTSSKTGENVTETLDLISMVSESLPIN